MSRRRALFVLALSSSLPVCGGGPSTPAAEGKAAPAAERAPGEPAPERVPSDAPGQVEPAPESEDGPASDPAPIAPTAPHAFTVLDLLGMDRISDHRISPDGSTIAFVRRVTDLAANKGRTDIWTVPVAGGEPVRVTSHAEADGSPRFSPDGKTIFFLSRRSGSSQVWSVPASGGEPTQITDLPLDVDNLVLSPKGDRIAFSIEVFVDCEDLACTKSRLDAEEADKKTGMVHDRVFARHWDTYEDGRRSHLFSLALPGGKPVDVTAGLDADVPSKPFGGPEEVAFSPDGTTIVFTARDVQEGEPWSTNFDLFAVPATGGERTNLTADNPAWDTHPVFSPDGTKLVWLAMKRPGYEADRYRIVQRAWPDGKAEVVTEDWDRSPGDLAFSPDGASVWVTAQDVGHVALFAVDLASGTPKRLAGDGSIGGPVPAGDRIVFSRHDLRSPAELWSMPAAGGEPEAITSINAAKVKVARMGEPEQFSFSGAGGDEVFGWVVKPADFEPEKKYPVAFLIHGGPQGSFGNMFHYRWNPQTYAGKGYAVVMIDFHGSTGYGQAFTDAIRKDWGGKPLQDLKLGWAAAQKKYAWLDGERACALGASYGGFMINWIAGQWPDGFQCLVNHDGVFDQRAMYFATEELWFPEWEQGGTPWEDPAQYEAHNPVRFVDRWKTPMLVVQGALDYRVPETQGLMAFTALQRRGIPSRLLFFPDENHWVVKPANSVQWHETVEGWLDRWLRPTAVSATEAPGSTPG
jgi:dipeptidyl aminopeptidase/acylaminoacyl peptidase